MRKGATVAHIDIDPAEIGKNVPTEIPIVASAKQALQVLLQPEGRKENHHEWISLLKNRKEKYPFSYKRNSESIKPQYAIDML